LKIRRYLLPLTYNNIDRYFLLWCLRYLRAFNTTPFVVLSLDWVKLFIFFPKYLIQRKVRATPFLVAEKQVPLLPDSLNEYSRQIIRFTL